MAGPRSLAGHGVSICRAARPPGIGVPRESVRRVSSLLTLSLLVMSSGPWLETPYICQRLSNLYLQSLSHAELKTWNPLAYLLYLHMDLLTRPTLAP